MRLTFLLLALLSVRVRSESEAVPSKRRCHACLSASLFSEISGLLTTGSVMLAFPRTPTTCDRRSGVLCAGPCGAVRISVQTRFGKNSGHFFGCLNHIVNDVDPEVPMGKEVRRTGMRSETVLEYWFCTDENCNDPYAAPFRDDDLSKFIQARPKTTTSSSRSMFNIASSAAPGSTTMKETTLIVKGRLSPSIKGNSISPNPSDSRLVTPFAGVLVLPFLLPLVPLALPYM